MSRAANSSCSLKNRGSLPFSLFGVFSYSWQGPPFVFPQALHAATPTNGL